jgi:hypothetical protein
MSAPSTTTMTTEPVDSPIRALRESLASVAGKISRSACGCTWKKLHDHRVCGVVLRGDVLIRYCGWHEWYAQLPLYQKVLLERQRRQVRIAGRPSC